MLFFSVAPVADNITETHQAGEPYIERGATAFHNAEDLSKRVVMVVMIGPSAETMFEFHLTDWVATPSKREKYPVQPEIEKIRGPKLLCAYGDEDDTCICTKLDPKNVTNIKRSGNHHFGGDFTGLAKAIWEALSKAVQASSLSGAL